MSDSARTATQPGASYARDVRATWWYTAASTAFFQLTTLFLVGLLLVLRPVPVPDGWAVGLFFLAAGGAFAFGVVLLRHYRRRGLDDDARGAIVGLVGSAASALVLGWLTGSPLVAAGLIAYALCLLPWQPGVRRRMAFLLLVVLIAVAVVEARMAVPGDPGADLVLSIFLVVLGPLATVSLWWWDIVRELDRARAAEGRLAAAQERLRLAGDLHDLQGHHLQVIALQLELIERTMALDPEAAAEHVRAAQRSVDDARRGTRELAAGFRGVPLPDELANAADLLRAAGLRVELTIGDGAEQAPSDVLGPIVREATTNILKHGGGTWARLALERDGDRWRLELANDPAPARVPSGTGAGLRGIAARVEAVGGAVTTEDGPDGFVVAVTAPATAAADTDAGAAR